jgi:hypothetical protein
MEVAFARRLAERSFEFRWLIRRMSIENSSGARLAVMANY